MKACICGKIGEETPSAATIAKFKRVEAMLTGRGYEVFNPTCKMWQAQLLMGRRLAEVTTDSRLKHYGHVLLCDLQALSFCDAVALLPDWNESQGAKAEVMFARALNIPVYILDETGELREADFCVTGIIRG